MAGQRYCAPCDEYTHANPCTECGADTDRAPEDPRERGDDDGAEYADPRDYLDGRE